jgi:hypothetical protein
MTWLAPVAALLLLLLPDTLAAQAPRLGVRSLASLPRYVGTYPCTNGIIVSPTVQNALRRVMGQDYAAYQRHLGLASCGPIEREGDYIVMDESRTGVAGHTSYIFVRLPEETVHVFWLKSLVTEKAYQIYGPRPVPAEVMSSIVRRLNEGWGKVATFSARGEKLDIAIKK